MVELGRRNLVRVVAAVGGVRGVVCLIDEPRLVGLRGLVLVDVVDGVVGEGGRRVGRGGDGGPVDVVRRPVEVIGDSAAENPAERGDPQSRTCWRIVGTSGTSPRAGIDAPAAEMVLPEEGLIVAGALAVRRSKSVTVDVGNTLPTVVTPVR